MKRKLTLFKLIRRLKLLLLLVSLSQVIWAQTIEGTVTDPKKETLPGVSVFYKGTTQGTITDFDGKYSIDMQKDGILVFSYVGMATKEVPVVNQNVINVIMTEDALGLEEVIIVGYGKQKKESVVGSITQTTGELVKRSTAGSDVTNSLTGLMPGVVTVKSSGIPGGFGDDDNPTEIYIRGSSTWNGGQPLVLVDGVEREMADVDPNEIENMSVLKDASATAVFGVKGANGVILITTKRGRIGKPSLSFEATTSMSQISKLPKVANSYDANRMKNIAITNGVSVDESIWADYLPPELLEYYKTQEHPELYPDVDWLDAMTRDFAMSQKYNLNVSGGTKFVKYFLSLGYTHEGDVLATQDFGQGYVPEFKYDRYSFRSNLDFDLTSTTTFSMNLSGYIGQQQRPDGDKWNFWKGIYGRPPDLYPIQYFNYGDGVFADYDAYDRYENSISRMNFGGVRNQNRSEINSDFKLKQKLDFITKGLSASVNVSYDNRFYTNGPNISDDGVLEMYVDPRILDAQTADDSAKYIIYKYPADYTRLSHGYNFVEEPLSRNAENTNVDNLYRSLFYQASINYAREFGLHSITGLMLINRREHAKGSEFTHFRQDIVGRVTYDFDTRYFVEFNGAYNGSEKFDKDYRMGFFPSLAGGWLISNESFIKENIPFINHLKGRYSWGLVGSDDGIERWQYTSGWGVAFDKQGDDPVYTYMGAPADNYYLQYKLSKIPNPNIRWETAKKQNIGLETRVWNNVISANFDYWWEHRTDMLVSSADRTTNIIFGDNLPAANIGELKANGWEVDLKFSKEFDTPVGYWVSVNWARARNEVINRDDPALAPDYQKEAGFTMDQNRTQLYQGIIQSWDEMYTGVMGTENSKSLPGDFRLIDYNADGKIDSKDEVPYGYSSIPEYSYGWAGGVTWKQLSAYVQFYGVYNVSDDKSYNPFNLNYSIVWPMTMDESWTPEMGRTETATLSAARYNTGSSTGHYWTWDYSYLKLQNLEMAYTFKEGVLNKFGVSNARLYVNGNNLITWNKVPEDRDKAGDAREYPLMRRWTFGLNVTF